MTKKENEYWYKQDLARYLKDEFAVYKIAADRANLAYKRECYRQGTSRPDSTPEWDQEKILKNDLQCKIERKLPNTSLFGSVYTWYGKLIEDGTINEPITHPDVLKLMSSGIHIGRIHPVGSMFRETARPERVYQITGLTDYVEFVRLADKRQFYMSTGNFQNKVKDGIIEYVEAKREDTSKKTELHQISFEDILGK